MGPDMWQERLSEFVTLFVVINPFGVLPAFLAATGALPGATQRRIAVVAVLVAFAVLLFFVAAGGFLLEKLGISLRAFQIAGGIVLFVVALEMVRGEAHVDVMGPGTGSVHRLAIYPIAIPKIASPGAMLAIVLLVDDDRYDVVERSLTAATLILVLALTLVILLAAAPISRVIGDTGASVIGRVLGIILAALAVNTILTALGSWLGLPPL
jgi:multiple antibiotic resistance protein